MKALILTFITIALSTTSLLAANIAKPITADMQSMIEGQIAYEVPLNAHVKKGELVERVDTTQYKATVKSDAAVINYDKTLYSENSKLYKTHSVSLIDYLKSKQNYEEAVEQFNEDKAILAHCSIYAPFAGTVTEITTYPRSGIGDGSLIMTIQKDQTAA
jgi:multidrug resistance efflux pump